jgi:hypothetical protein
VRELVDEARLADPCFADDRHHLAVAGRRELLGTAELLQLVVAADEPGQPSPGAGLKARPGRPQPRHLEDFHRLGQPPHRHRPQRAHRHVALDQLERRRRQEDATRARELLHPRCEMRRLAHGRVVHVEVAPDGADNDLARVEPDADLHVHAV